MKKRLLLASSLLTIPAITSFAVSCSNSNKNSSSNDSGDKNNSNDKDTNDKNNVTFNISPEIMKIYNSLFTTTGENKANSSIHNAQSIDSKSRAEVLSIAEQKLNTITSDEMKQLFLNSCLKGVTKQNTDYLPGNVLEIMENFCDIQNFKFDKTTNEVSFDYVLNTNNNRKIIETNLTSNWSFVLVVHVTGLKVKADVYSPVNNKKVIYPVISFETEQPNTVFQCTYFNSNASLDENFEREFWNKANSSILDYSTFEEFLNSRKETINQINLLSKIQQLGNKLGHVNGKFDFLLFYDNVYNALLFGGDSLGFLILSENEITTQSACAYSPIFFSTLNEDGTINWEIYNLV